VILTFTRGLVLYFCVYENWRCYPTLHHLSYCFQSLRLVCSSSHELLILGISVRIFLMQWFPLAFCMVVFRHTVGLLWTSDQPVAEISTCTGQHNIETQQTNIHAFSGIRTRDPSNQAAADLRLRPRGYRGRHTKIMNIKCRVTWSKQLVDIFTIRLLTLNHAR
jgi:hypothetical protein